MSDPSRPTVTDEHAVMFLRESGLTRPQGWSIPEFLDAVNDGIAAALAVAAHAPDRDRLAQIKARLDAATPGEWGHADEHGLMDGAEPAWCVSRMDGDRWLFDIAYVESPGNKEADAEFIACSRADIAYLLSLVAGVGGVPAEPQPDNLADELRKADAFIDARLARDNKAQCSMAAPHGAHYWDVADREPLRLLCAGIGAVPQDREAAIRDAMNDGLSCGSLAGVVQRSQMTAMRAREEIEADVALVSRPSEWWDADMRAAEEMEAAFRLAADVPALLAAVSRVRELAASWVDRGAAENGNIVINAVLAGAGTELQRALAGEQ